MILHSSSQMPQLLCHDGFPERGHLKARARIWRNWALLHALQRGHCFTDRMTDSTALRGRAPSLLAPYIDLKAHQLLPD
jgi:hypothetical protein